jgi:hypothetical protein
LTGVASPHAPMGHRLAHVRASNGNVPLDSVYVMLGTLPFWEDDAVPAGLHDASIGTLPPDREGFPARLGQKD